MGCHVNTSTDGSPDTATMALTVWSRGPGGRIPIRGALNRLGFRAASFLVRKDAIMPKHYEAEVKARAVRLVAEHKVESGSVTKSCEAVGRRLGISKETLRGWCRQAQVNAGEREGVTSEELAEIKRLKAENRRLREDVEILRAATTFFAGELDPRNR